MLSSKTAAWEEYVRHTVSADIAYRVGGGDHTAVDVAELTGLAAALTSSGKA